MFKNKKRFVVVVSSLLVLMITTICSVSAALRTKSQGSLSKSYIKSKSLSSKSKVSKNSNKKYKVVKGDTLWSIARKFRTSISSIKKINSLKSDKLAIGKVLIINSTSKPVVAAAKKPAAKKTTKKTVVVSKSTKKSSKKTASSKSRRLLASRGSLGTGRSLALPWSEVNYIFSRGSVALVTDVKTRRSFYVKRTFGTNHADCEALTSEDSSIIRDIWGGWSWERRPVIVQVDGKRIAASMTAMPHAGLDKYPTLKTVSGRSGGFGTGTNLDAVKGNGMNGHFDIHFLNSTRHNDGQEDPQHQAAIRQAIGK